MPEVGEVNYLALFAYLMNRLPLQSAIRKPEERRSEKGVLYFQLHDILHSNARNINFRELFGCLLVLCVQSRKKEGRTWNGDFLFSALSHLSRPRIRVAEEQQAATALKCLWGDYSKRFLTYAMMQRYAANFLVLLRGCNNHGEDVAAFPVIPRKAAVFSLFSPENCRANLETVREAMAGLGV